MYYEEPRKNYVWIKYNKGAALNYPFELNILIAWSDDSDYSCLRGGLESDDHSVQ